MAGGIKLKDRGVENNELEAIKYSGGRRKGVGGEG